MEAVQVRQVGGPEVLEAVELLDPVPEDGEALVRVSTAGVNFVDTYQRSGQYPRALPYVPGLEAAGVVVRLGPGAAEFAEGDRVAFATHDGAYAELVTVPTERLVPVPDGLALDVAGAVLLQGLTAQYLATGTAELREGDTVLLHAGAGGVGLLLTQMAVHRGATVISTVSTPEKAELAREAGAHHVVLYRDVSFLDEVKRLTDNMGVDVVFESVGRDTFTDSLACLRPRGLCALFGQASGAVPPVDPQVLAQGGSLYLTRPTMAHYTQTRAELLERAAEVLGAAASGELQVRIGEALPLREARRAHELLESRGTTGKVILEVADI